MDPIQFKESLSEEQYAVVMAKAQPLLVLAGAGAGKTRILVYRVAKLIEDGIPAHSILLLTFTNRAAKSMIDRLGQICGSQGHLVQGGTFHHVALQYLRRYAHVLNYTPHFTLLDRHDSKDVMDAVLSERAGSLSFKKIPKAQVLLEILSLAMNTLTPIHEVIFRRFSRFYMFTNEIAEIAKAFMEKKIAMNVMDFDDLLINLRVLLTEHPDVKDLIQKEIQAVLVDEYQDTNRLQSAIIDVLVSSHRHLTVVGDDAQSIYGFRGADVDNMLTFMQRYSDAILLPLNTNYRSTPAILGIANTSISYAREGFQKKLISFRQEKNLPALVPCRDPLQQADFVAQQILELKKAGVPSNEIAVLYRAHGHAIEIQMELLRRQIPFEVRSGLRFFEQAHIKDVMAYLRFIYNPKEAFSFKRVIQLYAGVGKITADRMWLFYQEVYQRVGDSLPDAISFILQNIPVDSSKSAVRAFWKLLEQLVLMSKSNAVAEIIQYILKSGYEEYLSGRFSHAKNRIDDIFQLAEHARSYASYEELMNAFLLMSNDAKSVLGKGQDEQVTLSSIHQAKGLEWRYVFVIWLCEGRFPLEMALREQKGIEEERRIFYVALTRAKDSLFLCYPQMFLQNEGRFQKLMKSRFIEELLLQSRTAIQLENWTLKEENDATPAV